MSQKSLKRVKNIMIIIREFSDLGEELASSSIEGCLIQPMKSNLHAS